MGNIYDISSLNSEINKTTDQKIKDKSKSSIKTNSKPNNTLKALNDYAKISDESIRLFNLKKESAQYIDMIKNVHLVSEKQLQELKENVLTDYYSQNEIVEEITEKLISMSNYKN